MVDLTHVVRFPDVFEGAIASQFQQEIEKVIQSRVNIILIDLKEVSCITSTGLLALLLALKTARNAGKKLFICSINEQVRILFELTGADKVFEIWHNLDELSQKVLAKT